MNNDIFKIQIPFKNWIFAGVQGLMFIFLLIPGALGISYFGMSESFSAVSFMEDSGFGAFAVVFLMLFFLVGIASILEFYVLGGSSPIREIVIVFYIANEGISIVENSARIGLPIPAKFLAILEQLKSQGDDDAGV